MTHYPHVDPAPNFPEIEERTLAYWQEKRLFEQSVAARPTLSPPRWRGGRECAALEGGVRQDAHSNTPPPLGSDAASPPPPAGGAKGETNNEFVFYDGPPFANGLPHYGHLLTGYVKDAIARYQTMQGKRVERRFGWDCHGLPAEMGAEKELNISGRQAIQEFGIKQFNAHCRSSVMKYAGEWEYYVDRQARWVDFENDYKTMDTNFMESVLWAFKQLYDKGYIYEAHRVMPYSWAAETPLSNFETKLDNSYREKEDKAITVAFELNEPPIGAPEADKYYVLAWTTTPWTLPSNLALAVKADMNYMTILKDGNCLILTGQAAMNHIKEIGVKLDGSDKYTLMTSKKGEVLKGADLINLTYKPLFPYFKDHPNAFRILDGSTFVTDSDGTGIVHMAPGFGEEDQKCCEKNGIELVVPVDGQGKYTDAIFDIGMPPPQAGGERMPQASEGGVRQSRATIGESTNSTRKPETTEHAKELRQNLTKAEKKLWFEALAKSSLDGHKFRKQQAIGDYIVDFVCMDHKLVVELDGGQHNNDTHQQNDERRTAYLESQGYRVLRFWNHEVVENLEGVVEVILASLRTPPSNAAHSLPPRLRGELELPPLSLKGLNVIAQTEGQCAEEPYKPEQLKKYGLVNLRIIQWLKMTGNLIKVEDFKHNYPHCWRTDQPLIYRAMPSWYVAVTKFKDRAVELNREINWIPNHIGPGQMEHMLSTAPDWSISRNRFWGTPIPVWRGDKGGIKVFGSIVELEAFFGGSVADLHRPYIDDLTKTDEHGETWTRVEDVFDCWFESGSMPFAQVHYPFENKDWFESHFPADFITEYVGQTRGWFNTLIMLSTALFDKPPFKNCICHGVVLDSETGMKYSKRLKNYRDPKEVMDTYGADALRWLMLASPVMRGMDISVDPDGKFIRDVVRLAIKPIWNAYNFFCLYANADGIAANAQSADSTHIMDRYILAKCSAAVNQIETSLNAYDTPGACDAVLVFFDVLNNWYIRRSKERFWKKEQDADKQAAYDTLYTVLVTMCEAAAPLLPFTLDEIYRGLTGKESVHLADFPTVTPALRGGLEPQSKSPEIPAQGGDDELIAQMDLAQSICNAALAIRSKLNIRVRQPLASLTLVSKEAVDLSLLREIIEDEVNVKTIHTSTDFDAMAGLKLRVNSKVLGKRLPAEMKKVLPASKKGDWKQLAGGNVECAGVELLAGEFDILLEPNQTVADSAQALSSNDALVILDTTITPELASEGYARDLVRMIQQARKDAGLNITDRIELALSGDATLLAAAHAHEGYITEQTLTHALVNQMESTEGYSVEQVLEDKAVKVQLRKVG